MQSIRWTSIKLGIFTLVTLVVTYWLASIIGNLSPFSTSYTIEAEFSDATGLLNGDVVKAAGVDVGRVENIRISNGIAIVTMELEEEAQVPASVGAQIRFRNLIGQRMITLVPRDGAAREGLLADGDKILLADTDPAFDLTVLFNGLRPVIRSTSPEDINIVTTAVTQALKGRSGDVEAFLAHVADISDSLASKDRQLTELLDNANVLTTDLAGRDQQLRTTLSSLNEFLAELDASKGELSEALVTLDVAATRLNRIVERNDENISAEVKDLAVILDAVDDKRGDLRAVLRGLPEMLVAVERVNSYGEWGMIYLVHACKDDFDTCGSRGQR
ncbi:MAG: MCE family protein [Actinomycetota bacterium]